MGTTHEKRSLPRRSELLLTLCLSALALLLVCSDGCITRHSKTDVHARAKFERAVSELYVPGDNVPEELLIPQEIGEPSSMKFYSNKTLMLIFETRAYILLCRYDEAEYAREKAALETRYSFRTEPLYSEDTAFNENAKELEPEFDIGGDHFRFIMPNDEFEGYMGLFFKGCSMVVTNDAEREIAYIVFKDQDLDVADDLTEFVRDTCGWRYVR